MPIKCLNVLTNDWCIKARVFKKSVLRTYKNAKGEGHILTLDLIDKEGTIIQGTMFNENAKKWFEIIQENKVYTFSGGKISLANKKFTSIKNDYCITFDLNTKINEVSEDSKIKQMGFDFTQIKQIPELMQNKTIDVIGVIIKVHPLSSINLKTGVSKEKKTFEIADDSNSSIEITIWGQAAVNVFL